MFDIGWSEFLLIGVVALIAIGPKELPGVLRSVGQWVTKIRRMAGEFQNQFQEAMREAEMTDLKKQVEEFGKPVSFNDGYDEYANPKPGVHDPYKPADDVTPGDAPWNPNPDPNPDAQTTPGTHDTSGVTAAPAEAAMSDTPITQADAHKEAPAGVHDGAQTAHDNAQEGAPVAPAQKRADDQRADDHPHGRPA